MTDEQITHMANRFLMWKLPADFHPDGGVSFTRVIKEGTPYEHRYEPVGTNLLSMAQAKEMIRHMLDGLPNG